MDVAPHGDRDGRPADRLAILEYRFPLTDSADRHFVAGRNRIDNSNEGRADPKLLTNLQRPHRDRHMVVRAQQDHGRDRRPRLTARERMGDRLRTRIFGWRHRSGPLNM